MILAVKAFKMAYLQPFAWSSKVERGRRNSVFCRHAQQGWENSVLDRRKFYEIKLRNIPASNKGSGLYRRGIKEFY